jgi:hypothetical protein
VSEANSEPPSFENKVLSRGIIRRSVLILAEVAIRKSQDQTLPIQRLNVRAYFLRELRYNTLKHHTQVSCGFEREAREVVYCPSANGLAFTLRAG